ncbi:MAG: MFS transporter [Rhizobiaceae bacterium]|nr:MFS transporter [Rhizobiaceae bacterium]
MNSASEIEEAPYGWVIVAVATYGMVLAFGANLSVSVLIDPLQTEFGWSRAQISVAYTMLTVGAAIGGLFWGTLSDRIGAKKIVFFGAIVLSSQLMMLSFQSTLWSIYFFYFVLGAVGIGALFTPLLALTGLWFTKRKGLALGIVTAGGAIGQGAIPLAERVMISNWGWRDAMFYMGVFYLVTLIPVLFFLKQPPVLEGTKGSVKKSNENSWNISHKITLPWLSFAGLFCCICMAAPLIHLVPLGMDLGFSPETAASLLFVLMLSGVFGRLFFGSFADRVGGLKAYFLASFGQTLSVFWFTQSSSLPVLYIISAVFGFAFAGVMTCLIICSQHAAPPRLAGLAVAVVSGTAWVGMGLGGYQAGYFFDLSGTYTMSYAFATIAGVINLLILTALFIFRQKHTSSGPDQHREILSAQ